MLTHIQTYPLSKEIIFTFYEQLPVLKLSKLRQYHILCTPQTSIRTKSPPYLYEKLVLLSKIFAVYSYYPIVVLNWSKMSTCLLNFGPPDNTIKKSCIRASEGATNSWPVWALVWLCVPVPPRLSRFCRISLLFISMWRERLSVPLDCWERPAVLDWLIRLGIYWGFSGISLRQQCPLVWRTSCERCSSLTTHLRWSSLITKSGWDMEEGSCFEDNFVVWYSEGPKIYWWMEIRDQILAFSCYWDLCKVKLVQKAH